MLSLNSWSDISLLQVLMLVSEINGAAIALGPADTKHPDKP